MIVELAPFDDAITEDDEDLFFELLGDPSYRLGAIGNLLVSLLDND